MSPITITEWPKLRVEFVGGKPSEILTVRQAAERFGVDESYFDWLTGYTAGTSMNHAKRNNGDVYMVHRYDLEDSIRDAAPDLLAALKGVLGTWVTNGLCPFGKGRMLKCECNYHAAFDAARAAWNKAEGKVTV